MRSAGAPTTDNLTQQPAIRVDYQLSLEAARHRQVLRPARAQAGHARHDPGIQRRPEPVSVHHELRRDGQLHLTPTTFIEGTYGFIRNQLAGGASIGATGTGGILVERLGEPADGLAGFPLLYPNAGVVDPRYYAYHGPERSEPGAGGTARKINLPPAFGWGSRDAGHRRRRRLPARRTRCSRAS